MRIESVRFDASGNPTLVVTGGVLFFVPLERAAELAALMGRSGGGQSAKPAEKDAWFSSVSFTRAFFAGLGDAAFEFENGGEIHEFLLTADEEEKARRRALALCARAEQSSAGLEAKLRARGFSAKAAQKAVAALVAEHVVDDARFARAWAQGRAARRAAGPARLAAELRSRGQSEGAIRAALEGIDFDPALSRAVTGEHARLAKLWRKKGFARNRAFFDTLYHVLRRQGFDSEKIRASLAELENKQV